MWVLVLVVAELFSHLCRFLPSRPKRCRCYPLNLWNYQTEWHQNCKKCKDIHSVEHFVIAIYYSDIAIRFGMEVRQTRLEHEKCWFLHFNWLPWQRPLSKRKICLLLKHNQLEQEALLWQGKLRYAYQYRKQEGLAIASIAWDVVVEMTPPHDDNAR